MARHANISATFYSWQWLQFESGPIFIESRKKFNNQETCYEDALKSKPSHLQKPFLRVKAERMIVTDAEARNKTETEAEIAHDVKQSEEDVLVNVDDTIQDADGTAATTDEGQTFTLFEDAIGQTVRVQARYFKGKPLIDIRHWVAKRDGSLIPTKKGIALSPMRWMSLISLAERIEDTLEKIKKGETVKERYPVSGPVFVQMSSPFWTVHVREWFKDPKDGAVKPGCKGIMLKHGEWAKLMQCSSAIYTNMPELSTIRPCYLEDDHMNQEGAMMCSECNPFGYQDYLLE